MKNYIENQVVIVTGGNGGFGLATAKNLLEFGCKVVITGRNEEKLAVAEKTLNSPNLLAVRADATNVADWKNLIKVTVDTFGQIDVLLNNHGAGVEVAPLTEQSDDTIELCLDINLLSVIKGCREVMKVMQEQGHGHILNVGSACSRYSWPDWSVYTAAKAALIGFTKCIHLEMAQWGGKATMILPGAAQTDFCNAANLDATWMEEYPSSEDFAHTIANAINVPKHVVVQEVSVWGNQQIADMMSPF